jgi:5'-3' exonuclease
MRKLTHLVVDGNAVLYKYYFGYNKYPIEEIIAVAHVSMLYKMQWLSSKYKVDNVVVTFDCSNWSWRKLYTSDKNTEKVTHRKYKAGRHEKMTEKEKAKLDEFKGSIDRYYEFFKTQTSVLTLQGNYLEGDDLVAGYIQGHPEDDHIIYSSDKDFMQLINSIDGNVTLVESQKDTERTLDDWNNNPDLFLFEKCFRGEPRGGDNVQNAYP